MLAGYDAPRTARSGTCDGAIGARARHPQRERGRLRAAQRRRGIVGRSRDRRVRAGDEREHEAVSGRGHAGYFATLGIPLRDRRDCARRQPRTRCTRIGRSDRERRVRAPLPTRTGGHRNARARVGQVVLHRRSGARHESQPAERAGEAVFLRAAGTGVSSGIRLHGLRAYGGRRGAGGGVVAACGGQRRSIGAGVPRDAARRVHRRSARCAARCGAAAGDPGGDRRAACGDWPVRRGLVFGDAADAGSDPPRDGRSGRMSCGSSPARRFG